MSLGKTLNHKFLLILLPNSQFVLYYNCKVVLQVKQISINASPLTINIVDSPYDINTMAVENEETKLDA